MKSVRAKADRARSKALAGNPTAASRRRSPAGILVLGMHRSGTSAITGVLNLLGVELGGPLLPAQEGVNDKGFWEHVEAVGLHERLLQWQGSNWSDIRRMPRIDLGRGIGSQVVGEARSLIQRNFASAELWALKDPRMSLFAPLWLQAMGQEGFDAKVLLAVRHPREVADSLQKRDGLTRGHALILWGRYIMEALRASEGRTRAVSDYSALMRDWRSQVQTLAQQLHVTWPVASEVAERAIAEFLSDDCRHHAAEDEVSSGDPVERSVFRMYAHLARVADGHDEWKHVVDAGAEFERVTEDLLPHLTDMLRQVWLHADRATRAEELVGSMQLDGSPVLSERLNALHAELAARDERILALGRAQGEMAVLAPAQAQLQGLLGAVRAAQDELGQGLREDHDARIRTLEALVAEKEVRLQAAAEDKRQLHSWVAELQLHANNLESRRTELESELTAALTHVAALKAQINEQGMWLKDMQSMRDKVLADAVAAARDREVFQARCDALNSDLAERDRKLQALTVDVACREDRLRAVEDGLASRDALLKESADELADYKSRLGELKAELLDRDNRLQLLRGEMAGRDERNQNLAAELSERDAALRIRAQEVVDLEVRVQNATQLLAQERELLHDRRIHAEMLEEQMRRVMASRSWRYTAMFRRVMK